MEIHRRWMSVLVILLLAVCSGVSATNIDEVLVLVMDQDNPYHSTRSLEFVMKLSEQALGTKHQPDIRLLSHRYHKLGAWTLFPVLTDLYKTMDDKQKWLFVCEEETRIDLRGFVKLLDGFNPDGELFLGMGLVDQEPSVVHHYAFHQDISSFKYPHSGAGFALSRPLLHKIVKTWLSELEMKPEFSIDATYEFAKFVYDAKDGVELTQVPEFCAQKRIGCVTWLSSDFPDCGRPVSSDDIFYAVKTCQQYHNERIPVIKDTWVRDVKHIEFYSDFADAKIPTLDLGVPNTKRGHCGKTLAILKRAMKEDHIREKRWFVLADDDTQFSVARLRRLLACYDPEDTIALGERYGYGVTSGNGYDYITLGGGMVLSRHAIAELIEGGFTCPQNDSPDDMLLGMALKRMSISIIHSPFFHQARPNDYAKKFIRSRQAVSFHRFWSINPRQMYKDYLKDYLHDEL